AVQERTARTAEGGTRVRLFGGRLAAGNRRGRRLAARPQPHSRRNRRAAADSLLAGRRGVGTRPGAPGRAGTSHPREAAHEGSVSYIAHGVTLALAWFIAINAVTSLAVVLAAAPQRSSPHAASHLLALRLLPGTVSVAFVAAIFLPSYWVFEPRDYVEGFDVTLTFLAIAATAMIAAAAARGLQAWSRAQWRARVWTRASAPVEIEFCDAPAFAVDTPEPMMALVGVVRPRLIVTRGLMAALTQEEIEAGAAHEAAAGRARANS